MLNTNRLRIGAIICAVLAAFVFHEQMLEGFPDGELVIMRKYVSETQFRIESESLKPGFVYDTTVSRTFYDTAQNNDHIRSPLQGCLILARHGRDISFYFSEEFVFTAIFILAALLPLIVFFKPETFPFRRVVWPVVAILEGVIISLSVIGPFLPG